MEEFTEHISRIDPHINFAIEPDKGSTFPFQDMCTHIQDDGSPCYHILETYTQ